MRNVITKQGDAANVPVGNDVFDVVFLVAVLGEVSEPVMCLQEIYRVLLPGGLLSITEQPGDADFIPLQQVKNLAEEAVFVLEKVYGKSRKNFTVNYRKPNKNKE